MLKLNYLNFSIEIIAKNKTISFGFATSWKAAANYIKEAANVSYLFIFLMFL